MQIKLIPQGDETIPEFEERINKELTSLMSNEEDLDIESIEIISSKDKLVALICYYM